MAPRPLPRLQRLLLRYASSSSSSPSSSFPSSSSNKLRPPKPSGPRGSVAEAARAVEQAARGAGSPLEASEAHLAYDAACAIRILGLKAATINRPLRPLIDANVAADKTTSASPALRHRTLWQALQPQPAPAKHPAEWTVVVSAAELQAATTPADQDRDLTLMLWLRLNGPTLGNHFSSFPEAAVPDEGWFLVTHWRHEANTVDLLAAPTAQALSARVQQLSQSALQLPATALQPATAATSRCQQALLQFADPLVGPADFLPPSLSASSDRLVLWPWSTVQLRNLQQARGAHTVAKPAKDKAEAVPLAALLQAPAAAAHLFLAVLPWRPTGLMTPSLPPLRPTPRLVSAVWQTVVAAAHADQLEERTGDGGRGLALALADLPVWLIKRGAAGSGFSLASVRNNVD